MATIRIADPTKPEKSIEERTSGKDIGGVYNTRQLSLDRRGSRIRRDSVDRISKLGDDIEAEDEDSGLRQSGDFKKKQVCLELLSIFCSANPHWVRSSKAKSCYGSHTRVSVSSMVTLEPVRSMSIPQPSHLNPPMKTSSVSSLSSSGPL